MARFLGIDLASDPKRTAACLLEWDTDAGRILEVHQPVDDTLAVELARGANLVAIDAPLGWPAPFVAAVSKHADGAAWPATTDRDLAYRRTDQLIAAAVGWWPLSVSTDRIGIVAFRAARLHVLLQPATTTRDGGDGVIEVYPGAALHRWGLAHRRYKRSEGRDERVRIVAGLPTIASLDLAGHEDALIESDDRLDALIAALVAVAKHLGLIDGLPIEHAEAAQTEGWIWLPTGEPLT